MKAVGPIPPDFVANEGNRLMIGGSLHPYAAVGWHQETPVFLYDWSVAASRVERFRAAMPAGLQLHYAVKANPFEPIVQGMASRCDGLDLASGGEIEAVVRAGARRIAADAAGISRPAGSAPLALSFAGPGKRDEELRLALEEQVTVTVESAGELERLLALGGEMDVRPTIAVRVNPPFGLKGSGMKMGGLASQFGVDHDQVPALVRRIVDNGAEWRGLHVYSGSQSLSAEAIIDSQRATVALAGEIAEAAGAPPPEVNLGGGFGIPYFAGDKPLDVEAVGAALGQTLAARPAVLRDTRFVIELGRWLVGECGVYLTRVVERKVSRGKTFLVVDGGLHHMLAASGNFGQLLRRNYPVAVAHRFGAEPEEEVSVVGCLCTPLDLLADEVLLPRAEVGDVIAIFCAGAYGLSASPQGFLSQAAAREVLV
jgi:diaminopimelate decarboxylase